MKTCVCCKVEKLLSEFNKNKSRKDGLQGRCKECDRTRSNNRYKSIPSEREKARIRGKKNKDLNRKFVYEYFSQSQCVKCGETDPVVLEFDHVEPTEKLKAVSQLVCYSRKTLEEEIKKCQVLCANCHRRKTAIQLGWYKGL